MDKKGVLGLDTAKGFILLIMIVGVLSFAAVITLSTLDDTTDNVLPTLTVSFTNITTDGNVGDDVTNPAVYVTAYDDLNYKDCALTVTEAHNTTDLVLISAANYSISGCKISYAGTSDIAGFNDSGWTVSGSVTYISSDATNVLQNVSKGTSDFFGDTGTWFTLLSVVVIILIIGVVIFAVSRFGGGSMGGGSRSGSSDLI